jgi:hypothetical protein
MQVTIRQQLTTLFGEFDVDALAGVLSKVFYPPFITVPAGFLILYLYTGSLTGTVKWLGICVAFVTLPAGFYIWNKVRTRQYASADVPERRNRLGIYLFGGLCLVACLVYLIIAGGPRILVGIFVAAAATNAVALVINQLGYKLSVHSGTMAAIAFVLLTLSLPWSILATTLMGIVGWARKRTKNHTWGQIVGAWAITVAVTAVVFTLYVWQ